MIFQLRGILSGVVLSSANLLMFVSVHMYPTLRDSIGLANTFIMYGTTSLFGKFLIFLITTAIAIAFKYSGDTTHTALLLYRVRERQAPKTRISRLKELIFKKSHIGNLTLI